MESWHNSSYVYILNLDWHQMSGIYSADTSFHIDGLSLLWSASHSLGRNPLRAVIPFDSIWFVAHRGKWWVGLLSWPSRNKPYQIRHIGLSVLAHTMGINWSSNTTDKSILSFPPELSGQLDSAAIWSTEHLQPIGGGFEVDWQWCRGELGKLLGRGSPSENHWQQEWKWRLWCAALEVWFIVHLHMWEIDK